MSISPDVRKGVRLRANSSCEFCGVSEQDSGGQLTIDHFQPLSKGGNDHPQNLIYCCSRCNLYNHDYFPKDSDAPMLSNPRKSEFAIHFMTLEDGKLDALDGIEKFTIKRLRLNRPPLIAWRIQRNLAIETQRLLTRYQELLSLQTQLSQQLATLAEEQNRLLISQQELLKKLIRKRSGMRSQGSEDKTS